MDHDARPLGPGPFRRHSLAPAGAFSAPPSNHSLDAPIASGAFQRCSIPNVNGTIHSYLPSSGDCPSSSSHHDARPLGPGPCRRHFVAAADALAAPSSDHNQKMLPRQAVSRCADPNVQARPSSLELMLGAPLANRLAQRCLALQGYSHEVLGWWARAPPPDSSFHSVCRPCTAFRRLLHSPLSSLSFVPPSLLPYVAPTVDRHDLL